MYWCAMTNNKPHPITLTRSHQKKKIRCGGGGIFAMSLLCPLFFGLSIGDTSASMAFKDVVVAMLGLAVLILVQDLDMLYVSVMGFMVACALRCGVTLGFRALTQEKEEAYAEARLQQNNERLRDLAVSTLVMFLVAMSYHTCYLSCPFTHCRIGIVYSFLGALLIQFIFYSMSSFNWGVSNAVYALSTLTVNFVYFFSVLALALVL